jgi:hypothetical protein
VTAWRTGLCVAAVAAVCGASAPSTGRTQQSDAPEATRSGLELIVTIPPQEDRVRARVAAQISEGCASTAIRYGPSAGMRGTAPALDWSDTVRLAAAAAAMTDDYDSARTALAAAKTALGGDGTAQAVLANQEIETALQFSEHDEAKRLLALYPPDAVSGGLRSDRLFWQALLASENASVTTWRKDVLPRLDAALAADPTSFQVRVWRVIAWIRGRGWADGGACGQQSTDFADRVLDATRGSACPLMLGHMQHAIDRGLRARPDSPPVTATAAWHLHATGLVAILAGDGPTLARARTLVTAAGPGACRGAIAASLASLKDLVQ